MWSQFTPGLSRLSESELTHTCVLAKAIEKQFLNENTGDTVLIVEKERLYVHKIILAARSEYFNTLFYGDMKESKMAEIDLHDTAVEPFKLVLKFAYSSKINLNNLKEKTIMETLELARRFMIEDLKIVIYDYLKKKISVANLYVILDLAVLFQMENVKYDCFSFAENNAEEILQDKSFLNMSATTLAEILALDSFCAEEITIFRAVQKWIAQNKPENAENILRHIRLPLIRMTTMFGMTDLYKEIRSSTVFSDSAILSAIETQMDGDYEEINYRNHQIDGKNLASRAFGAKVISGNMPQFLLDGNSTVYDYEVGYTWHPIKFMSDITVELKKPYRINNIRMLLWDLKDENSSYDIMVSVDGSKWSTVINNRDKLCKSWQTLSFRPTIAKLIKIVGTFNSSGRLSVVSFECSFKGKLVVI